MTTLPEVQNEIKSPTWVWGEAACVPGDGGEDPSSHTPRHGTVSHQGGRGGILPIPQDQGLPMSPRRLSGSGSVIGSGPGPRSLEAPASEGPLGRLLKKTEDLGWPAEGQRPHHAPHTPPPTYFQSPEQTWNTTWAGLPSQHSRATEKVLGERGRGRPPREDDGLSVTLRPTQHNTGGHQHSFKDLSRVELPPQTMCPSPNPQHL